MAFCIFCLVDIQLGNRLYYTVIGLDYTTRAALIDAITRTGVPPINPSYYPGHPEQLTYLYYFWYILGSLVDQLGGKWVDSRAALIASVCWCGLGLMATIAVIYPLTKPERWPESVALGLHGNWISTGQRSGHHTGDILYDPGALPNWGNRADR